MIRTLTLFFLFSSLYSQFALAQSETSKSSFAMPITGVLGITGSFGEIRSDHFHSGVDLRTDNKIGKEVRATQDGYISRIKVSPVGYGKSIFIDHKNGLTSGYGHLDRYSDQINEYVKTIQYQLKSFDIDVFPKSDELPVKKGDLIGYSGNSGGSSGPHLHYEVRTTIDQRIINPIPNFLNIVDSIAPIIRSLHIYRLDSQNYANGFNRKVDFTVFKAKNGYTINSIPRVYGKIGIGVDVFDRLNNLSTQCGFKNLSLSVNGKIVYNLTLDKFAFAETRYVNSIIDYETQYNSGKEIVKLFVQPANFFSGLRNVIGNGVIPVVPDSTYKIEIIASDASNNSSKLSFSIKGINPNSKPETKEVKKDQSVFLSYKLNNSIINDTFNLTIPKNSIYDNMYFVHSTRSLPNLKYSPLVQLHFPQIPLQQKINLKIKAINLPVKYQSKALLATIDKKQKIVAAGGEWVNGFVSGNISSFGKYFIAVDTLAPEILPINIRQEKNMSSTQSIIFKTADELSGIKKINGYIDNQWVVFDYDLKNDLIQYFFDKKRLNRNAKHTLEVVVSDAKNNENRYKCDFYW